MYNDREDREEEKIVCVGEEKQIVRVETLDGEWAEERAGRQFRIGKRGCQTSFERKDGCKTEGEYAVVPGP